MSGANQIALEDDVERRERVLLDLTRDLAAFSSHQRTLSRFNLFEAVGLHRQEIKHSNFLAFLLRPQEGHGLGDRFLKQFLQKAFENLEAGPPIRPLTFSLANFDDAVVLREWRGIDILIESKANGIVVVVENKVDAAEGKNQLLNYEKIGEAEFYGQKLVFAYLTPNGDPPTRSSWTALSYSDVIESLVETNAAEAAETSNETRFIIGQYIEMLPRNLVPDQELIDQCRKIYLKHKDALDLIYRYGEVNAFEAAADLFFRDHPEVKALSVRSGRAAFLPIEMSDVMPQFEGLNWFGQSRPVLFWFYYLDDQKRLGFVLEVGPFVSEKFPRDALARKLLDHFGSSAKVYPKYTRVYTKYVKMTEEQASDVQAVHAAMNKYYADFSGYLTSVRSIIGGFFVRDPHQTVTGE